MRLLPALLALALTSAIPALAQSDEPLPYDDGPAQGSSTPDAQPYSDPSPHARQETEVEQSDRDVSLARFDDPLKGFVFEATAGALFLDSSRGAGSDGKFVAGLRFTWEFGRMMADDVLHDGLFMDVLWLHTAAKDGTAEVFDSANFNYFTVAPAFELPFGHGSPFGAYAQMGIGAALESSTFTVQNGTGAPTDTPVGGLKPLFQYGIGLRARPPREGKVRLEMRLELSRFRRGYMNDTFLGGTIGLGF